MAPFPAPAAHALLLRRAHGLRKGDRNIYLLASSGSPQTAPSSPGRWSTV